MQEGKETMERREISREKLVENMKNHEKETREGRKLTRLCSYLYFIFVLLLYLYLGLYNTKFEFAYDRYSNENSLLCVKYSTAWVIRFPAEYEGRQVLKASSRPNIYYVDWDYRYPYVRVLEVEKGIQVFTPSGVTVVRCRVPKYTYLTRWWAEEDLIEYK